MAGFGMFNFAPPTPDNNYEEAPSPSWQLETTQSDVNVENLEEPNPYNHYDPNNETMMFNNAESVQSYGGLLNESAQIFAADNDEDADSFQTQNLSYYDEAPGAESQRKYQAESQGQYDQYSQSEMSPQEVDDGSDLQEQEFEYGFEEEPQPTTQHYGPTHHYQDHESETANSEEMRGDHQHANFQVDWEMKQMLDAQIAEEVERATAFALYEQVELESHIAEQECEETAQQEEDLSDTANTIQSVFEMYAKKKESIDEMCQLLQHNFNKTKQELVQAAAEQVLLQKCEELRETNIKRKQRHEAEKAKLLKEREEREKEMKETLLQRLAQKKERLADLKKTLQQHRHNSSVLDANIEKATARNKLMTELLSEPPSADNFTEIINRKKAQLNMLQTKNEQLLEKYNASCEKIQKLESALEISNKENESMQTNPEQDAEIEKLKEEVAESMETLRHVKANSQSTLTKMQEDLDKLNEQFNLKQKEHKQATDALSAAQQEFRKLSSDLINAYEESKAASVNVPPSEEYLKGEQLLQTLERAKQEYAGNVAELERLQEQHKNARLNLSQKDEEIKKVSEQLNADLELLKNDYKLKKEESSQTLAKQQKKKENLVGNLKYLENKRNALKKEVAQEEEARRLDQVKLQTMKLDFQSKQEKRVCLRQQLISLQMMSVPKKSPLPTSKSDAGSSAANPEKKVTFRNYVDVKYPSSTDCSQQTPSEDDNKRAGQ